MHEVPEEIDLQKVSKACDHILRAMRSRYMSEEDAEAFAIVCAFVNRVKKDIFWIEAYVKLVQERSKEAS